MKRSIAKKPATKRSSVKELARRIDSVKIDASEDNSNKAPLKALGENKWVAMFADNFGSVLLIVAAFLIGMLFTEVRYLKKTAQAQPAVPTAPSQQQAAPENAPLTDELWKEVLNTKPAFDVGNKDAKVTMVEFTDYQCPFCSRFYTQTQKALTEEYIKSGKVRLMIFDYPLGFHPNAKPASELARCVGEEGKYEQMHNVLFEEQDAWANLSGDALTAKFQEMVKQAGGNPTNALSCLKEGRYSKAVDESFALGNKAGVSGTPSFIINKELVVGAQPIDAFKAVINKSL